MDEDEITVYLENETTQKFNSWLEDCFQKLDIFYSRHSRKSGIVYKFHKPVIDGKDTRSYILAAYNIGRRIERGIILKWVEVGARLKVMITFRSDPKIIYPVLDILIDLSNDFPDAQGAVLDTLRRLKNKYQIEDSILSPELINPILASTEAGAAQVDARQVIEPPKPEKPQAPESGSSIAVWFDYYHAMNNANYKMTFSKLEKLSGYSKNTFKAEHGRYKSERGIDQPNT